MEKIGDAFLFLLKAWRGQDRNQVFDVEWRPRAFSLQLSAFSFQLSAFSF